MRYVQCVCGDQAVVNVDMMLMSNPPQHEARCPGCGAVRYVPVEATVSHSDWHQPQNVGRRELEHMADLLRQYPDLAQRIRELLERPL